MARRKKSQVDDAFNRAVGERVRQTREDRGWTLADLGTRLGMSIAHLKSLESGTYSFSAPLLSALAHTFHEPVSHFVGADPRPTSAKDEWLTLFDTVSDRYRSILLDMARRLSDTPARGNDADAGKLISLEGIDGALLRQLGQQLSTAIGAVHCDHDYESDLWRHMIQHLGAKRDGTPDRGLAFQRTLLFACERVHRQESAVRPALEAGQSAVVPFWTMASSVYQEAEGVGDHRLIDVLETLLVKPDVVLVIESRPVEAARKAVRRMPVHADEFYSAFHRPEDFVRAQHLYRDRVTSELSARGYVVRHVDGRDLTDTALLLKVLDAIADAVREAGAAAAKIRRAKPRGAAAATASAAE